MDDRCAHRRKPAGPFDELVEVSGHVGVLLRSVVLTRHVILFRRGGGNIAADQIAKSHCLMIKKTSRAAAMFKNQAARTGRERSSLTSH
jgi:hypothetical protein